MGLAMTLPNEWLSDRRRALEALRADLLAECADEDRELATPAEDRGEDITPSQHPADVASDLEGREFALTRRLIDLRELQEVESALARVDAGTYGLCADCRHVIPRERLDVRPHAARDIECERKAKMLAASSR